MCPFIMCLLLMKTVMCLTLRAPGPSPASCQNCKHKPTPQTAVPVAVCLRRKVIT